MILSKRIVFPEKVYQPLPPFLRTELLRILHGECSKYRHSPISLTRKDNLVGIKGEYCITVVVKFSSYELDNMYFRLLGHVISVLIILLRSKSNMEINEHAISQQILWTLKFEFCVIFTCDQIIFILTFFPLQFSDCYCMSCTGK
jgi:hypothetical protein